MHKQGVAGFPYYVGVNSLSELATKDDRVVVLNILGKESSTVTPTSHEYSGGNVVFGTGPGKSGKMLPTRIGNIPVYNSIKEGLEAGHKFNTAVVYLPPSGVKDGVAEAVRQNPGLKKVIVLTEKVSVKDSRIMRAICQANGVDLFGGNCLGVADAWNHVRIGGALGGSHPEESLIKGSVAIFSNSGNFTTTIAVYLATAGWGTTTSVSSGKDVYIHYGPQEFIHAFNNDDRSQAAILYAEPGGYYEHGIQSSKPIIACVVGRWKAKLTKSCGHAGSLAGSGDDAVAKENWFMEYFGTKDIFTPGSSHFTKKGALVTNIAHIPDALTQVMAANGRKPDFEPKGDLSLKCWFGSNNGINLPSELNVQPVPAIEPYRSAIEGLKQQVGAQMRREAMKDASGASRMDPKTQVSQLYGMSILDLSRHPLEQNLVQALTHEHTCELGQALANLALNAYVNQHGKPTLAAAEASRAAGNSPNTVLSSAVSIVGRKTVEKSIAAAEALFEMFKLSGLPDGRTEFDYKNQLKEAGKYKDVFFGASEDPCAQKMLAAVNALKDKSTFLSFLQDAAREHKAHLTLDALIGGIWTTIGWVGLMRKRITRHTLIHLSWYGRIFSTLVGCAAPADRQGEGTFCGVKLEELIPKYSFTKTAFLALLGREPSDDELFEFQVLLGLIITNGPGTISAQGAKGAVSADGPEQPERVQVNKCFAGFMTHTGFAHGGNGYEAAAFLIEHFKKSGLKNPADPKHGIDLGKIAMDYANSYAKYKKEQKELGNLEYGKIPCVNHPIFKGKEVNIDPREDYVRSLFREKNIHNVFLDFYHELVQALFKAKVSNNVYCVNIDAVIAVILLKMVWADYQAGKVGEEDIEMASFTAFLFGRMIGCAAEIDDHSNRGRNMDTRSPASQCLFVG